MKNKGTFVSTTDIAKLRDYLNVWKKEVKAENLRLQSAIWSNKKPVIYFDYNNKGENIALLFSIG